MSPWSFLLSKKLLKVLKIIESIENGHNQVTKAIEIFVCGCTQKGSK